MPENELVEETVVTVPDDEVQEETIEEPAEEPIEELDDDLPEIPEEQKTAFQKRLEREQKKIRETVEQEVKQKYSRHENIVNLLGGDLDTLEQRIQEQQWAREAQTLGYEPEDSEAYVRERRRDNEIFELRVDNQINDLRDNPTYAGIKDFKTPIKDLIRRSGGSLTAEQAYFALGGAARVAQAKREAEQREIAKRTQGKRTVQTDSATGGTVVKPLPPEIEAERKKLGLSVQEARELMEFDASNIDQYRKSKKRS